MRDRLMRLIAESAIKGDYTYIPDVADYLLENGVIVPPCKVGDDVYILGRQGKEQKRVIIEGKVERFAFNKDNNFCIDTSFKNGFVWRYIAEEFKRWVFLTKEEAERALKGGEG